MLKKFLSIILSLILFSTPVLNLTIHAAPDPDPVPAVAKAGDQTLPPEPWGPTPSAGQLYYQKQELSAFIHFGMNTFTNKEWGDGKESPPQFTLSSIDSDQWVKTFKDAGFGRLIMVGKHHDGFCNWSSALTEHCVKNSPGKIDVLAEVSKSATEYDLDMGIYLSPWDVNTQYYGMAGTPAGKPYNDYYKGQLREILGDEKYGNKGKFVEVWMDGAKASGVVQPYYFTDAYAPAGEQSWWDLIKSYNQDTVIFAPYGAEVRWIGNEAGRAGVPCWSKINWADQKARYDSTGGENASLVNTGQANGVDWSVPEADVSLVPGWFAYNGTPKSMSELAKIYFETVGRGAVLLLNAAPGRDGKLSSVQESRIREFGQAIRETFKTDLAADATAAATSTRGNSDTFKAENVIDGDYDTYWTMDDGQTNGSLTLNFDRPKTFDVVSLQEYIPLGQRISKYNVEVYYGGKWNTFGKPIDCQTVGYKALVRDEAVTATAVRINITASQAVPVINTVGVYKAADAFELPRLNVPSGSKYIDCLDPAISYTGGWTAGTGADSINDTHKWSARSGVCTATVSFTGTNFYIVGILDPVHGSATVTVDGVDIGQANFYSATRAGRQLIYSSPDLEMGTHTLKLTTNNAAIDLDGIYYFDAGENSVFVLDEASYNVSDDAGTLDVVVRRTGNIEEAAQVQIYTEPGTGVHGKVFEHISQELEFAPGETEKTVSIEILNVLGEDPSLNFYVKLGIIDEKGTLGLQSSTTVTVWNTQTEHEISREYLPTKLPADGTVKTQCDKWDFAWPAEAEARSGADNGYDLGWLGITTRGEGRVKFWYDAPAAGKYSVLLRYFTGRAISQPNKLKWQGPNVGSGEILTPNQDNADPKFLTAQFMVHITKAGKGYIEWYNDTPGTSGPNTGVPNLDYMIFSSPPAAPGNIRAANITKDSAKIAWNASNNNVGVAGYKVYIKGTLVADIQDTFLELTGLDSNTEYTYTVIAYDETGNESEGANITFTTKKNEIDAAIEELGKAAEQYRAIYDKGIDEYTEISWNAFQAAYQAAQAALTSGNRDFAALTQLKANLETASKGLTKKPVQPVKLAAPKIQALKTVAEKKVAGVKITVSKVEGTDSYTVYRKNGKQVKRIGNTNQNRVVYDKNPVSNKKVSYYAVADSKDPKYLKSDAGQASSIKASVATSKVTVKQVGKTLKLSWKKVKNAKGFVIYRSNKKGSGYTRLKVIKNGKILSFTDKKVTKGKKYYYKVVVKGKKAYSGFKASKGVKVK